MLRTQAATLRNTGDVASLRGQTLLRLGGIAVAATVAAILEVVVARALPVGAPRPHLVLIGVVALAVAARLELTVVAALAGGLALDVLAFRPLGLTPFGLLLAGGVTAAVASPITGTKRAVGVMTVVPAAVVLGLAAALGSPPHMDGIQAGSWMAPGAALDLMLACPLAVGGVALRCRLAKEAAPSK